MNTQDFLVHPKPQRTKELLYEGRFLTLRQRNNWEYVERQQPRGIVAIFAVTLDEKILLVEQYRPPLQCNVIEIPAGLVGDIKGSQNESFEEAARRELLEETGYNAAHMEKLMEGPISPGLSTEIITFFRASGLRKEGNGRGDSTEDIRLHEVSLKDLHNWLEKRQKEGILIDCKIYAALFFGAKQSNE